jgi:hypothetical protein
MDKELELALLRSQDPSEQQSVEVRDMLLALKLSQSENPSAEVSSDRGRRSDDDDEGLWLYDGNRDRVRKTVLIPVIQHRSFIFC